MSVEFKFGVVYWNLPAVELDHNLAVAVVVDLLELANVTCEEKSCQYVAID